MLYNLFFSYEEIVAEKSLIIFKSLPGINSQTHMSIWQVPCTLFLLIARWIWWETQMTELPLEIQKQWIRGSAILALPQTNWEIFKAKGKLWEALAYCFSISTVLAFPNGIWWPCPFPPSLFSAYSGWKTLGQSISYDISEEHLCAVVSGHSQVLEPIPLKLHLSIDDHTKSQIKGIGVKSEKNVGGYDIKPPELRLWQNKVCSSFYFLIIPPWNTTSGYGKTQGWLSTFACDMKYAFCF